MRASGIRPILLSTLLAAVLFTGCADQPVGYIFTPNQRNQSSVARTAVEVINALYEHADPAGSYLENAAHTDDYLSLLPTGWFRMTVPDSVTGRPYPLYQFSYLNQKYYLLRFDREPSPTAVRQPSSIDYTFASVSSFQNRITNRFFGSIDELRRMTVEYARNRTDTRRIDGWFENARVVALEQELTTATGVKVTYYVYVPVTWIVRIIDFTIDANDQSAKLILDGQMPIYDELGEFQECHLSGEFRINSNGSGSGEINLYGAPAARFVFTSRQFGFKGHYSLAQDNFRRRHQF